MAFKVVEVIDGDTFRVQPTWNWKGHSGDRVRPIGWDAPERGQPGYLTAKSKLTELILGRTVDLRSPVRISYDRLLCEVYLEGKNIASFFPAYR